MQDAAGAWIKTQMSRIIMLGGNIKDVKDFFACCKAHLTSEPARKERTQQLSFTAHRKFVLLDIEELAIYRNRMAKVPTWTGIQSDRGWYAFYPMGTGVGYVARQWLACMCDGCSLRTGRYDETKCENAHLLTIKKVNHNTPEHAFLEAKTWDQRTKQDELSESFKVIKLSPTCY
jgi:hypothetical protein